MSPLANNYSVQPIVAREAAGAEPVTLLFMKAVGLIATIAGATVVSAIFAVMALPVSEQYFGIVATGAGAEGKAVYSGLIGGIAIAIGIFLWARNKRGFGGALIVAFAGTPWIVFAGAMTVRFVNWVLPGTANLF